MRKFNIILLLLLSVPVYGQDKFVVFMKNGTKTETLTSSIDSVTFLNETTLQIHFWNSLKTDIPIAEIDSMKTIPDQCSAITDREALIEFFNSTGGPNWVNKTNWGSSLPLNKWYGVDTDSNGRVYFINLDSNNLKGSIPAKFAQLTRLKSLCLQVNQLSGSIPVEFGNLINLEYLNIGNNKFSGSIPAELGKLINLNKLLLFTCQFSGTIPLELKRLTKLNDLTLSGNQLTGTIPSGLCNLKNLKDLDLYSNQLTGNIPGEIEKLVGLNTLRLGYNKLSGSIPGEISKLTNLQYLSLGGNPFSGSIPSELFQLSNLEILDLTGIKFTGSIPPGLGNLSNLKYLYLYENRFSGTIPPELGKLSNLNTLNLRYNELTGSIPPELRNLSKLQSLVLSSNFLTCAIPPELGRLSNLERLDLSCNQLSGAIPAELGDLQKIQYLDLSFNSYLGEIPREVARLWSLPNLLELNITNNRFSGILPSSLTSHPRWNENVWGIVQQKNGYVFDKEIVKTNNSQITDINGNSMYLGTLFASNKLTVVFYWSDWDPFTGQFLPILKNVYQNFASKGLGVVSFNYICNSNHGNINILKDFIKNNQMAWTNVLYPNFSSKFANFPNSSIPNVHIVNQNGDIVFSDILWDKREDFEKFITSQLGELQLYQSIDYSQDGKVTKLQSATKGRGVNIVLMGDGFVDTAMNANGSYEQTLRQAMEHFFSIEPTKSYREYFNVYMVKAVSKNGVFMDRSETVFSSKFGLNRGISGDWAKIKEYAKKIEGLNSTETHIITILNSTGRAGSCYQYDDGSISLLSAPYDVESFSGVLQHEAVGHGLGKLGDEYIDYYQSITPAEKDRLNTLHLKGWYLNLSLSSTATPWAHFIGNPKYNYVGAHEGGFYYWKGVWRPEETGTMIVSKSHYFNGPSREQIVKRTLQAAGVTYSWDDFVVHDKYEPILKFASSDVSEGSEKYELNTVPVKKYQSAEVTQLGDNLSAWYKYESAVKSTANVPDLRKNEQEFHTPPVIMNKKLFEK